MFLLLYVVGEIEGKRWQMVWMRMIPNPTTMFSDEEVKEISGFKPGAVAAMIMLRLRAVARATATATPLGP